MLSDDATEEERIRHAAVTAIAEHMTNENISYRLFNLIRIGTDRAGNIADVVTILGEYFEDFRDTVISNMQ